MKIQYLNGGLANQVFQYIFVRFAELSCPEQGPWFLDDSFFNVQHVHNGYELEKVFGIRARLLSSQFDPDVWEKLIDNKKNGTSLPQALVNMGCPLSMIAEFPNYKEHNPFSGLVSHVPGNEFHPEITALPGNYYYHGYWIHPGWFTAYRDIFLRELAFPPITDRRNQEFAQQILSSESIGVHVRRGDYVELGWSLGCDWYSQSVSDLTSVYPNAVFFVFSDDTDWCRRNERALGLSTVRNLVYVDGNTLGKNYMDLQLMSMCQGLILSNSAFSYLAALLNRQLRYFKNPTGRLIP